MNQFRVRIYSLADTCRIEVDGVDNARWLIGRLSQFYLFRRDVPLVVNRPAEPSSFEVAMTSALTCLRLEKMLGRIQEVQLLKESSVRPPIGM